MAQTVVIDGGKSVASRVGIAVYAVAVLFVILRFVTRGWLVRKFGLDDLLIGIALFVGAGETATLQIQAQQEHRLQSGKTEQDEIDRVLLFRYINMMLYYLANGAVKLSILALYYRFCSLQRDLPWFLQGAVIWSMGAVIAAFTISTLLVEMFGCMPMSAIFDMDHQTEKCIAWVPFYLSQATIDVLINLILVLFPLPLIGILKVDKKRRYALVGVFSIGLLPLMASIVRLCQIAIAARGATSTRPSADASWEGLWIPLWSQIEVDVGIVAACLPSLSPLLRQIWSVCACSKTLYPAHASALIETGFGDQRGVVQGLQTLPNVTPTLAHKSVITLGVHSNISDSTLGELEAAKHLTFFDDARRSEDGRAEHVTFPEPSSTSQIGVAMTVDTRLSRATFVDVPFSPRRSNGFTGISAPEAAV